MDKYIGIADTEGLESIMPEKSVSTTDLNMMLLRARFNPHRKALVYRAELTTRAFRTIGKYMKKGEYRLALFLLKECATVVELTSKSAQEWWHEIPHITAEEAGRACTKLPRIDECTEDPDQLTMFGDHNEKEI